MTYTIDQLRKLDTAAIACCSSMHIRSVLTDVIATAIQALSPAVANAAPELPLIGIQEMCKILDTLLIKRSEFTDCTILYQVTFEQLRSLYMKGIAAQQAAPKHALTDEQIAAIHDATPQTGNWVNDFARAIEAASAPNAQLVEAIKGLFLAIDNVSPGPGCTDGFSALLDAQVVAETALAAAGVTL